MDASSAPENHEAQTKSSRRNGLLFVGSVTAIVLILLATSSGYFASTNEPTSYPTSPKTITQQQLTITTGIDSWTASDGSDHYQWDTLLRATSKANVVSIKAILNITRSLPPVVQTRFHVGFSLIGPNNPLNHNQTTGAEAIDLIPTYQNFLHPGQSFPESVMATFNNGTSITVQTSADVWRFPEPKFVAPTIEVLDSAANVNKSDFSSLTVTMTLKNTGSLVINGYVFLPTAGIWSFENLGPGQTVSGSGRAYLYPIPNPGDSIQVTIVGGFPDGSYFRYQTNVTVG